MKTQTPSQPQQIIADIRSIGFEYSTKFQKLNLEIKIGIIISHKNYHQLADFLRYQNGAVIFDMMVKGYDGGVIFEGFKVIWSPAVENDEYVPFIEDDQTISAG